MSPEDPNNVKPATEPPMWEVETRPDFEEFDISQSREGRQTRIRFDKIALFIASLFLFVLAILLMKEGARDLTPLIRDTFAVSNAANSLGFGWLFAYVILSGSPVAAAALAFFDAGALDTISTFTMITGSRIGASFIVLLLGFFYVLRGRNRATSLSMGLMSLSVSGITHLAGLFLGIWMLQTGILNGIQLRSGSGLTTAVDILFQPLVDIATTYLPGWGLFALGMAIIIASFSMFDRCLPEMSLKDSQVGRVSAVVYRPWVMFILGALITTLSMSVSISLGILVPLSHRGFIRRENVIPYIMGANVTTFVDTLLAAVLLNNPEAFTIVLVEMVSIALVSMLVLAIIYRPFEHSILRFVRWATDSNWHFAIFLIVIFAIPLIFLFI
ncbi:MAG: hypothetical protein J5I90_04285 [Caldilineales bacterium]|nr:hypothetical protein [Caldilineales bacterium]